MEYLVNRLKDYLKPNYKGIPADPRLEITPNFVSILLGFIIHKCRIHPVTLELIWEEFPHPIYDDWIGDFLEQINEVDYQDNSEDQDSPENQTGSKKMGILEEVFPTLKWDTIIYPDIRSATFKVSKPYLGDDQRLGVIFEIKLHGWNWTIKTPYGLTLRNITEGVFRMKQSKNNFWNELFSTVKMTPISKDHMEIDCEFTHGSCWT